MFGRNGAKATVAETASSLTDAVVHATNAVVEYVDPLAKDEKLRRRLAAAFLAAAAAQQRVRRQTGLTGLVRRLSADPALRGQLLDIASQLQAAQRRVKKTRRHPLRNTVLFMGGTGVIVAAIPAVREKLTAAVRGRGGNLGPAAWRETSASGQTTIEDEIEVGVSVSTAYNQWTQFEEFPSFMEGVDEVRQLDDTLLHWAATVSGRHAEWDAKIVEQEPDRRITWESVDGKPTRGTVTFDEAGPERSRIRLQMVYTPEGIAERVGSAAGLDKRRIHGDLERFRELIENQQVESGAWRGEVNGVAETPSAPAI